MFGDVGLPMQTIGKDRDEILIIEFDGFIKNESECMIRTMIREYDKWVKKYPKIVDYMEFTKDELYHETMLFRPIDMLSILAEEDIPLEELENDLDQILENILFTNSKTTSFEFALYQILQEKHIKTCYIFKNDKFYDNEIKFINRQFKDVLNKIQFSTGGIITLFKEVKATTLFITNPYLPLEIFPSELSEEELEDRIFVVLNSVYNIEYTDNGLVYRKEFSDKMAKINEDSSYGILPMFNFPLLDDEVEQVDEYNNEEAYG